MVVTICAIVTLVYLGAFWLTDRFHQVAIALVLIAVASLAYFVLLPVVTRHHLTLSNEQLDYIAQFHRAELCIDLQRL